MRAIKGTHHSSSGPGCLNVGWPYPSDKSLSPVDTVPYLFN